MNFGRIIFLLIWSVSLSTFAQVNDSLEKILKTKITDTTRVQVLNKLAFANLVSDPRTAHEYSVKALKLYSIAFS